MTYSTAPYPWSDDEAFIADVMAARKRPTPVDEPIGPPIKVAGIVGPDGMQVQLEVPPDHPAYPLLRDRDLRCSVDNDLGLEEMRIEIEPERHS